MTNNLFYSCGKLMITGEYFVLDGAISLSLPTIFGQSLSIKENSKENIEWTAFTNENKQWVKVIFDNNLKLISEKNNEALNLQNILTKTIKLNPNFKNIIKNKNIETYLDFDKDWGLGSSSTLINNISQWANISAFSLLEYTMRGSGYDIAVSKQNQPTLFQIKNNIPVYSGTIFNPIFKDELFFIYLNKKQSSKKEITNYYKIIKNKDKIIKQISEITKEVTRSNLSKESFEKLIFEHENIISKYLKIETIKNKFFSDFQGCIKSLGAWGGDFILAIGEEYNVKNYFKKKGFNTILKYNNIILNN